MNNPSECWADALGAAATIDDKAFACATLGAPDHETADGKLLGCPAVASEVELRAPKRRLRLDLRFLTDAEAG